MPFCTRSLSQIILFHIQELLIEQVALRKEVCEKYLLFRILTSKDSFSVKICQARFANNAWLNDFKSLMPIPPLNLAKHRFSHFQIASFYYPYHALTKKLEKIVVISLHMESGNWKHDRALDGIADKTDFNITSFPTRLRSYFSILLFWISPYL